jgi:hypothetical protein
MVLMGAAIVLAGCADDGPQRADAPATTTQVATDLAPSQVAASTVAPPAAVPLCDVADLEFAPAGETVILIHNVGSVECEVDVSDSPNRDPLMEPSVWLRPDGNGELAIATDDSQCEQPATVARVDLVVNGEAVEVPVSLPATCAVTLTAIYTAD